MPGRSSEITRLPSRASGTDSSTIARARPSTIAVLPTPASPISTGLFFVRRLRISMVCSISSTRPITGSSSPFSASAVRSVPNLSSIGVVGCRGSRRLRHRVCRRRRLGVDGLAHALRERLGGDAGARQHLAGGGVLPEHEREEEVLGVDVGRAGRARDLVRVEQRAAGARRDRRAALMSAGSDAAGRRASVAVMSRSGATPMRSTACFDAARPRRSRAGCAGRRARSGRARARSVLPAAGCLACGRSGTG